MGLLAAADGLASGGMVVLAVRLLELGWLLGTMLGLVTALIMGLCAALAGARISQALDRLAQAAREMALGGSGMQLPLGPSGEVARLSSAVATLSALICDGHNAAPDIAHASNREPPSGARAQ
jgi:HAMP domain-containing protein